MDAQSLARHKPQFLAVMPNVSGYNASFASINKRWGAAITAGMIEAGRMDQEAATLFNPLIQDMGSTKEKFRLIQDRLINAIIHEMVKKSVLELSDAAKFAINILKRNLYERTADVGYLATDAELVAFLSRDPDDSEAGDARERMVARLREYQREYTVYNEIILLDLQGRVRAHLDEASGITASRDPLIRKTLDVDPGGAGDKYVETFRPTDLRPGGANALIYSQTVLDASGSRALGVLCLCFDFNDEMRRIFQDLEAGGESALVLILDERGGVIASADEQTVPVGASLSMAAGEDFSIMTVGGREYLAVTRTTDGYQGFYGLPWYGAALVEMRLAFSEDAGAKDQRSLLDNLEHFSPELESIQRESDEILADMTLDSLNGQVKAAKFQADGFVEVLRFVNTIGREIGQMFTESIAGLQATIVSSLSHGVQFRAFQANNIADRNLYERANDVCWWALTPRFREALAGGPPGGGKESIGGGGLRENLQFINDLYTPYLRLVLAGTDGRILAVSNPPAGLEERLLDPTAPKGQELVGRNLPPDLLQRALRLAATTEYVVSPFADTELYGGRPTYVFATAVRAPGQAGGTGGERTAGVLAIVFDAEPQFTAMLSDVLPRDENKRPIRGSFAIFADRDGRVISSTDPGHAPGARLDLPGDFTGLDCGGHTCSLLPVSGRPHLVGCQVSNGYREFKTSDGYQNDMLCLVYVPV